MVAKRSAIESYISTKHEQMFTEIQLHQATDRSDYQNPEERKSCLDLLGKQPSENMRKYSQEITRLSDLSIAKRNTLIEEFRTGEVQVLISMIGVLKAGVNEDMLEAAIQMSKKKPDGKTRSIISWGESVVGDENARAEI